jgi:hypothetical protein
MTENYFNKWLKGENLFPVKKKPFKQIGKRIRIKGIVVK